MTKLTKQIFVLISRQGEYDEYVETMLLACNNKDALQAIIDSLKGKEICYEIRDVPYLEM